MNVQRFFASNSREALNSVKQGLGPDAVILSNRSVEGGVEMLAVAGSEVPSLTQPVVKAPRTRATLAARADAREPAAPSARTGRSVTAPIAEAGDAPRARAEADLAMAKNVIHEIKSLRGLVEDQLSGMAWGELARRDPTRSKVLRELLRCGFSAQFARELAEKLPEGGDAAGAAAWIRSSIVLGLQSVAAENEIVNRGGVYALIGPTGVGKTTTTAKLAARCVVRHGADKVALLTTDGYRIGAHEQLRIYGKILGLAVHAVKDANDLNITLSELRGKHLILIDTVGMSQRDQRLAEQIAMLSGGGAQVKRLLLLPATSSGDMLEDVVRSYQRAHAAQDAGGGGIAGCILTKIDEGVKLGTVLDAAIRHRLPLHYVANGQRVPEDLHLPNLQYLLHRALRPEGDAAFTLQESEVALVMGAARASDALGGGLDHLAAAGGAGSHA